MGEVCLGGHVGGGEGIQAADTKMRPYGTCFRVCLEGGVGVEDKQLNTTNVPIWIHWWWEGMYGRGGK